MTVREAWQGSWAFRWVMSIIAGTLVAALAGGIVLYAEVKTGTALMTDMNSDIKEIHKDFNDRLLYLERHRSPASDDL